MKNLHLAQLMLIAACSAVCALSQPTQGQCEITKLLASDGNADDNLGLSSAISGDVAITGAPYDAENGFSSGSAYIFRMDPETLMWVEEAKLISSDIAAYDNFGLSVDIDGDVAVVGAWANDDAGFASGSAYVFRYQPKLATWVEQVKLLPSDGTINGWFGKAVSISGNVIVIGAPADDENGFASGATYIFRYDPESSTWIEEDKLFVSHSQESSFFGYVVAIDGDVAIIGAFGHDDNGTGAGAAFIFRFDPEKKQWNEEAELLDLDGAPFDNFGDEVYIDGDLAIVGAPDDDDNGGASGSAFIFRYDPKGEPGSKWIQEAKLLASDGDSFDSFGNGVAIADNVAVVGATGQDGNAQNSGSIYVFHFESNLSMWLEVAQIFSSDILGFQGFGSSVALSGNLAIIGAHGDDENGANAGAAYIFAGFSDTDCNDNGEADYCDIFDGTSNDQNSNGLPDECDADLNGNGSVSTIDLLILFSNWGPCDNCKIPEDCPADLDGNCSVGIPDLEILLENWG